MFDFQTTFTMGMNRKVFDITFPNYNIFRCEIWLIISTSFMMLVSLSDAVTLTGSSEYAVLGTEFTLTCDVPEEATLVTFYRRPDVTLPVGSIQVGRGGGQCYNRNGLCTANVCSCVTSGGSLATVFRWIIQPQTGDQGSVWYCRHSNWFNPILPEQRLYSDDYTLILADGPGTSLALSPANTTYTRTEGDTLPDITCTADCRPDCTFVWTRPDNTNFTVSPVLSLGQLDRSEHGTYICTARNDIGESIISTEVALDYGPSASLALSPPDTTYTRTEGDTLPDITCTADCRPDCTFVWTRPDNTNFTVSPVLSLGQLDRSEQGSYRCTARNDAWETLSNILITVQYGPSAVSLTPPTVTYTPTEGQSIPTITCSADCNPDCTYSWTKDGQTYTTGSGLQLTNIQRGQTGVYRCTASNVHRSTKALRVNVTVYYGPSFSVTLTPSDRTYTMKEGDTLPDITCTADCRPGCTFVWTRPDNTNFTVSPVLSLGQLDRSEHGTYRCTARNVVEESISFSSVSITYGPSTVSLTPSTVTYTPTEGQTIPTITCSADCNPACTYSWTKDGQSYTTGSGLQLTYIQRGQTGVYRCTASNLHGSTTAVDVSVTVYHSPSIRNLKSTLDSNLREGGSTSLVCTVESVPASTIQWFYGDNVTVLLESSDVLESIYTLTNAGCMDTGLYTCSVRNSVSTTAVTRDIPINVLCKPRADPRVNIHHNVGLAISESLTLTALFLANPEPSFTWTFREGRGTHLSKLVDGEDNFVSQNSFQLNSLTAMSIGTRTHIQEQWFGTYDVTATNSEGSELISFTVVPQGRPVRPYHATVACVSENRAFLSWRSEFNGGSTQTFVIGIKSEAHNSFVLNRTFDTPDPGQHKTSFVFISGLSAGTQYFFNVYAVNKYGNSTLKRDVNCTTDSVKYVRFNNNGLHAASIALIVILVVLMLIGVMAVFTRKGRRWCRQFQLRKQDCQDAQISERAGGAMPRDTVRSQNPQTDGNDVAMDTIYTDISRHRQGAENVSGHSDGE
ncbi:hemicentin-2-like isoform X2 [Argopecten irradians]|uniref:hemicentin-2-like isoform X2 n=1 Tax=Argopecten irradians TaxID=31199 RepID=UPI0037175EAB